MSTSFLPLYSRNMMREMKSTRTRWVEHVEPMGRGKICTGAFRRNPKERSHLEKERGRWENNIKTLFEEIGRVDVNRVHVAQCRNKWWAVVNAVMNLRDPQNARSLWLHGELLASQERLCCMEFVTFNNTCRHHVVCLTTSITSPKATSPRCAIWCFLSQFPLSYRSLKVVQ